MPTGPFRDSCSAANNAHGLRDHVVGERKHLVWDYQVPSRTKGLSKFTVGSSLNNFVIGAAPPQAGSHARPRARRRDREKAPFARNATQSMQAPLLEGDARADHEILDCA